MAATVFREQFLGALAQQADLNLLYQAIPASADDPVWIEFHSAQLVARDDALAALTQSTYAYTDAQMDALFATATGIPVAYNNGAGSTTQLVLYNKALRHLGERKLASMTENREPRRYLDDEWGDAVQMCLRSGLWNFAMRAIEIDYTSSVDPNFGYQNAFPKPTDWVRTSMVSTSETFSPPLRDYQDQGGYWLCNSSTIYVRYVSSILGTTLTRWPVDFAEYVGVYLAKSIADRITQDASKIETIEKREKIYWKRALANDAMDQPPQPWPLGTWSTSRIRRGSMGTAYNSIRNW